MEEAFAAPARSVRETAEVASRDLFLAEETFDDRGRDPDAVRAQYARDVHPMFERYVRPTARWATLTLSGGSSVEVSVGLLVALLTTR